MCEASGGRCEELQLILDVTLRGESARVDDSNIISNAPPLLLGRALGYIWEKEGSG